MLHSLAAVDAPWALMPRRFTWNCAVAPGLHPERVMAAEQNFSEDATPQAVVYQFTVLRGMAVALVIETPDWYSGLLQAALARVRLEGLN
jgi:hypothetical protein